jgi:hypothetical protein
MLTRFATRDVPKEQRMAFADHEAQDTTARNYEHLTPGYLGAVIREVDCFFDEPCRHTTAHLRYASDTGAIGTDAPGHSEVIGIKRIGWWSRGGSNP